MNQNTEKILLAAFSLISKAGARKKLYAHKAHNEGREELSHLLRTISESENIQSRRLFNSLRGQLDLSDQYISTIFEKEIKTIIKEYSKNLEEVKNDGNRALTQVFSQLLAAEKRIINFYSHEARNIKDNNPQKYHVCNFCGYISTKAAPEICPVCGACKNDFREIL